MALGKVERKTYLRLSRGKVRQTVESGTPGAIPVEVKDDDGKVVKIKHELQFQNIEGIVKNVTIKVNEKGDYPDQLVIEMEDGIDYYYVQISIDSSLTNKLINKFCNPLIDWTSPIRITPYFFEDQHTNAIVVEQNGMKIPPKFTKDEPGQCPQIPQKMLDEKLRSTRTKNDIKKIMIDISGFLQDYFAEHVIPIIRKNMPQAQAPAQAKAETGSDSESGDDLPF